MFDGKLSLPAKSTSDPLHSLPMNSSVSSGGFSKSGISSILATSYGAKSHDFAFTFSKSLLLFSYPRVGEQLFLSERICPEVFKQIFNAIIKMNGLKVVLNFKLF